MKPNKLTVHELFEHDRCYPVLRVVFAVFETFGCSL